MAEDKKDQKAPKAPKKPRDPNAPKPYRMTASDKDIVKKALVSYKDAVAQWPDHPAFDKVDYLAKIENLIANATK